MKEMGYAIAGLYVVLVGFLTPILHQLFVLTDRVGKLESKIDNLASKTELEEVKRRVEVLEKKLAGTPA